ncbi:LysR family transcriptional regulator, partial [Enterocloster bolteae]|nr:LysR family transcriptional regulator [Enterocloster bolteae]
TEQETIHNIPSMFSHKHNLSISYTYSFDFMNQFLKFKKKKPPTPCEDSFKETALIQTIRDVVQQRYRMSL